MDEDYFHDWCFKEIKRLGSLLDEKIERSDVIPSLIGLIRICQDSGNLDLKHNLDLYLNHKAHLQKYLS